MAISSDVVSLSFTGVVADVPISCDMKTFSIDHVQVFYGNAQILAVRTTDYAIELNEDDAFVDFVITPTEVLIDKIATLIASSVSEANIVTVKRIVPFTSDIVDTDGFLRTKIVQQFDLVIMMMQQLNADFSKYTDVQESLAAAQAAAGIAQLASTTAVAATAIAVEARDIILAQDFTNKADKSTAMEAAGAAIASGTLGANPKITVQIAQQYDMDYTATIPSDTKVVTPAFMKYGRARMPAGTCITVAGTTVLPYTLKRNGALLLRASYSDLWTYVQTCGNLVDDATWLGGIFAAFSQGDGATTFRLPDDRGYFERFLDEGRGVDVGRPIYLPQADELKAHNHSYFRTNNINIASDGANRGTNSGGVADVTGTTGGVETRPKNVARLALIAY